MDIGVCVLFYYMCVLVIFLILSIFFEYFLSAVSLFCFVFRFFLILWAVGLFCFLCQLWPFFLHTLIIYWRLINHIDDTLTVNQCQRWQFEDNWQWHALIIIENNIDNMENNIDNWEQYWQYWPSEGQWSAPDWQIHAASENQELHQHSISICISIIFMIILVTIAII